MVPGLWQHGLDALASDMVGDGGSPNVFFVTDGGHVVTVTTDRSAAWAQWRRLADRLPLRECALEDRQTGVLASVEPAEDGSDVLVRDDGDDGEEW